MKFPFVTRRFHENEMAEAMHAVAYQKQRRDFWLDKHRTTEKNLRETFSQRDMAMKNYQRITDDMAQTLEEFGILEKNYDQAVEKIMDLREESFNLYVRLQPFLRTKGPNGKFVKTQPKGN